MAGRHVVERSREQIDWFIARLLTINQKLNQTNGSAFWDWVYHRLIFTKESRSEFKEKRNEKEDQMHALEEFERLKATADQEQNARSAWENDRKYEWS